MRWLKTLVIGMGAVIVIGLTVVIVEVVRRAGKPSQSVTLSPLPPAPPVIGAPAPAAVTPLAAPGSEQFIALSILLAVLVGVLRLLLGLFHLGMLVNLLSRRRKKL